MASTTPRMTSITPRPSPGVTGQTLVSSPSPYPFSLSSSMGNVPTAIDASIERQVKLLFEKNTIEKIRAAEQTTRKEIEAKRQELRKLVGTRYRDLIYSADSIVEMRNTSRELSHRIEEMETECESLKTKIKTNNPRPKDSPDRVLLRTKYDLAKKIKLLVDTPERIWSALENSNLFKATNLYLQTEAVHSQLHLDKDSTKLLASIPLLSRQWAALGQFPTKIKNNSRARLLQNGLLAQEYAGALSALVLLDNLSVEKAFEEFLSMRKRSLLSVFAVDQSSKDPSFRMATLIRVIQQTFYHVKAIFHSFKVEGSTSSPLLISLLSSVPAEAVSAGVPTQWTTVSIDRLKQSTRQWLLGSLNEIREGGQKVLSTVTDASELAALEATAWKIIRFPFEEEGPSEESSSRTAERDDLLTVSWSGICNTLIGEEVDIWGLLLRDIFLKRGQELLMQPLRQLVADKYFKSLPREGQSVGAYVWQDDGQDRDRTEVTKQRATGITAENMNIIDDFDSNLSVTLRDLQALSNYGKANAGEKRGQVIDPLNTPPTKSSDVTSLRTFLKQSCCETIRTFVDKVEAIMGKLQSASSFDGTVVDQLLFIGRSCKLIAVGSQHLTSILSLSTQPETGKPASALSRLPSRLPFRGSGESIAVDPMLNEARQLLHRPYYAAHIIWANWTSNQLAEALRVGVKKDSWTQSYREKGWEELTIKVETEGGEHVDEIVRLPFQPSSYISSFLFTVCQELHRIGGHTVEKGVVRYLALRLSDILLDIYAPFGGPSVDLGKEGCIQMLFDLRLAFDVLKARAFEESELRPAVARVNDWKEVKSSSEREKAVESLLGAIQNKLDPIDVAFYEPHIQTYVQKCYQRSTILYGSLTQFQRLYMDIKYKAMNKEQHTVIPLAPTVSRFSLLPITAPAATPSPKELRAVSPIIKPANTPNTETSVAAITPTDTSKPLSYMDQMKKFTSWVM